MSTKRIALTILVASAVLLAVLLGASQATGQQSGPSPQAVVGTSFTYQGQLQDAGGNPVNDTCNLRFSLWDDPDAGAQVGTHDVPGVSVSDGLFTALLDFGDVFDGTALWLQVAVQCTADPGYATLSPRQPLTAAPYALYALNADLLDGQHASAFAGAAHTHLGQTWTGNNKSLTITGDFSSGEAAPLVLSNTNSGGRGLHISQGGDAGVSIASANFGVHVDSAGSAGVYVNSAVGDGVHVYSAGDDGVYVYSAGDDGVQVDSAGGDGVQVDSAGGDGVYVNSAGGDGVYVNSAVGDGVRATGTVYNALYGNTTNAQGEWGVYTPDKVHAQNVTLQTLTLIAQVTGPDALSPGDVVAAAGVAPPLLDNGAPLPLVRLAAAGWNGVVGVVEGRLAFTPIPQPEGKEAEPRLELRSAAGPARPGDYVALTVLGVARVKVDAGQGIIQPGTRLTSGAGGRARALKTVVVEGLTLAESAPVLGIALAAPDEDGLVWVLVNPQ